MVSAELEKKLISTGLLQLTGSSLDSVEFFEFKSEWNQRLGNVSISLDIAKATSPETS